MGLEGEPGNMKILLRAYSVNYYMVMAYGLHINNDKESERGFILHQPKPAWWLKCIIALWSIRSVGSLFMNYFLSTHIYYKNLHEESVYVEIFCFQDGQDWDIWSYPPVALVTDQFFLKMRLLLSFSPDGLLNCRTNVVLDGYTVNVLQVSMDCYLLSCNFIRVKFKYQENKRNNWFRW